MTALDPRIIDQFNQRAPFKLEDATVLVLAIVGSTSHNTYVPKDDPNAIDDVDFMGVVIPPASFTFGVREWEHTTFQFEELDCVFYSFRKFMLLMLASNPNVLGLAYLKPEHYVVQSPMWKYVVDHRGVFSSMRAYKAFTGYAYSQFKRMTTFDIATQTEWDNALELITAAGWTKEMIINKQSRPMPDLPAVTALPRVLSQLTALVAAHPGKDIDIEYATNKLLENAVSDIIHIHAKHFQGYMGEKRKNLVRKFGYDTKNAAHLIRLMRMCNEYLTDGSMNVFRTTDADEIRAIKSGKWTLEEVKREAERLFAEAKVLKESSTLPADPDIEAIDALAVYVYLVTYNLRSPSDDIIA